MKLEEYLGFPRHAREEVQEAWTVTVTGAMNHLSENFDEFVRNEIDLVEVTPNHLLPTLRHYGDDWKTPRDEYAIPDEWVHDFVEKNIISFLRERIAGKLIEYSRNPVLSLHPNVVEATELYKEMGTFSGRERIVQLILKAKIDRENPKR